MSFEVTSESKKVGKIVTIYGEGGIGKTTLIAQAVKAGDGIIVSCGEDGVSPLQQDTSYADLCGINRVGSVITNWGGDGGFVELLRWLCGQEYKVVALDSVSMLMQSMEEYCFNKYYVQQPTLHGKDMTQEALRNKAYGFAKSGLLSFMNEEFQVLIKALRFLREKGVDIYITSHTAIKKGRVAGEEMEYDFASLDFPSNKNVSLDTQLYNISDAVLYGKRDVSIFKGKKGGVAGGSYERILQTEGTPTEKAKNRFSMPEVIPANYEELKKYIN